MLPFKGNRALLIIFSSRLKLNLTPQDRARPEPPSRRTNLPSLDEYLRFSNFYDRPLLVKENHFVNLPKSESGRYWSMFSNEVADDRL